MATKARKKARSVSQFKEYNPEFGGCPYRYYLKRIEKVWEKPAAWLPQGLAVHEAAEAYERSERTMSLEDTEAVYEDSYRQHMNRLIKDTPDLDAWFNSGKYRGREDAFRRRDLGREQVARYIDYYDEHPSEVVWFTPDGEPAIELETTGFFGDVEVRGYVDQVIEFEKGEIRIRDIKSGNKPGDDFQLAVYARLLEEMYDVVIRRGDYWMGRNGKPTVPFDLRDWTYDRLTEEFGEMDEGVREERFDPAPDQSKCMFCPVKDSCKYRAW